MGINLRGVNLPGKDNEFKALTLSNRANLPDFSSLFGKSNVATHRESFNSPVGQVERKLLTGGRMYHDYRQHLLSIQLHPSYTFEVPHQAVLDGIDGAVLIGIANRIAAQELDGLDAGHARAFREYKQGYVDHYGQIKVFYVGMRQPIPLDGVYVAVEFLDSRKHRSLDDMEALYRERGHLQPDDNQRQNGIGVANDKQYLMVLGGPGVGKSTFLRKVGLEALKGEEGDYKYPDRNFSIFLSGSHRAP